MLPESFLRDSHWKLTRALSQRSLGLALMASGSSGITFLKAVTTEEQSPSLLTQVFLKNLWARALISHVWVRGTMISSHSGILWSARGRRRSQRRRSHLAIRGRSSQDGKKVTYPQLQCFSNMGYNWVRMGRGEGHETTSMGYIQQN